MRNCPWTTISLSGIEGSQYESRSPYWTIAFARYANPVSAFSSDANPGASKPLLIVENDAVAVSISSAKSSFGKMANVSLKITNINYAAAVSNGDWMFIWMHENEEQADKVINELIKVRDGSNSPAKTQANKKNDKTYYSTMLTRHDSGLKFMGRVTSCTQSDSLSGGTRQSFGVIQGQAFLEFASSIYYLYDIIASLQGTAAPSSGGVSGLSPEQLAQRAAEDNLQLRSMQGEGLAPSMRAIAKDFYQIFNEKGLDSRRPDIVIGLIFILSLGAQKSPDSEKLGVRNTYNSPIIPPSDVFEILGKSGGELWQIYKVYLGLQKYSTGNQNWNKKFAPILPADESSARKSGFLFRTDTRCKGSIPDVNLLATNQSVWSTLNTYLNPICNEMYTALKLDHNGHISPSLIIREIPFSTGIGEKISVDAEKKFKVNVSNQEVSFESDPSPSFSTSNKLPNQASSLNLNMKSKSNLVYSARNQVPGLPGDSDKRTYYGNLPRWIIDESVILDFTWSTDEADRVNFVQIFGTNGSAGYVGESLNTPDKQSQDQLQRGNLAVDEVDIKRHGLRAFTAHSPYDVSVSDTIQSLAPTWTAMNADWKFNGHLKAKGNLTIVGTSQAISEGDNLEVRGILFHIESVSHQASLGNSGVKKWTTTFTLSNGVVAKSLDNLRSIPRYIGEIESNSYKGLTPGTGYTQVQNRISGKAKDPQTEDKLKNSITKYKGS